MTARGGHLEIDRRRFLAVAGSAGAAVALPACGAPTRAQARPRFATYPFTLGVASGDPEPDGVVLWTRLAPNPLAPDGAGGMASERGYVRCQVTPQRWRSDYRVVASAADTTAPATTLTSWVVEDGRPGAQSA